MWITGRCLSCSFGLSACSSSSSGHEESLAFAGRRGSCQDWTGLVAYVDTEQFVGGIGKFWMLLWHIWSIRNKVVHEGASPFIASSVTFLIRYMRSLLEIRQHEDHVDLKGKRTLEPAARIEVQNSDAQGTLRWKRPPQGTLKINVDAAFNHSSGDATVGVAIRDWGAP